MVISLVTHQRSRRIGRISPGGDTVIAPHRCMIADPNARFGRAARNTSAPGPRPARRGARGGQNGRRVRAARPSKGEASGGTDPVIDDESVAD